MISISPTQAQQRHLKEPHPTINSLQYDHISQKKNPEIKEKDPNFVIDECHLTNCEPWFQIRYISGVSYRVLRYLVTLIEIKAVLTVNVDNIDANNYRSILKQRF